MDLRAETPTVSAQALFCKFNQEFKDDAVDHFSPAYALQKIVNLIAVYHAAPFAGKLILEDAQAFNTSCDKVYPVGEKSQQVKQQYARILTLLETKNAVSATPPQVDDRVLADHIAVIMTVFLKIQQALHPEDAFAQKLATLLQQQQIDTTKIVEEKLATLPPIISRLLELYVIHAPKQPTKIYLLLQSLVTAAIKTETTLAREPSYICYGEGQDNHPFTNFVNKKLRKAIKHFKGNLAANDGLILAALSRLETCQKLAKIKSSLVILLNLILDNVIVPSSTAENLTYLYNTELRKAILDDIVPPCLKDFFEANYFEAEGTYLQTDDKTCLQHFNANIFAAFEGQQTPLSIEGEKHIRHAFEFAVRLIRLITALQHHPQALNHDGLKLLFRELLQRHPDDLSSTIPASQLRYKVDDEHFTPQAGHEEEEIAYWQTICGKQEEVSYEAHTFNSLYDFSAILKDIVDEEKRQKVDETTLNTDSVKARLNCFRNYPNILPRRHYDKLIASLVVAMQINNRVERDKQLDKAVKILNTQLTPIIKFVKAVQLAPKQNIKLEEKHKKALTILTTVFPDGSLPAVGGDDNKYTVEADEIANILTTIPASLLIDQEEAQHLLVNLRDLIIPEYLLQYNHLAQQKILEKDRKDAFAMMIPICMHTHFTDHFTDECPKKDPLLAYLNSYIKLLVFLSQQDQAYLCDPLVFEFVRQCHKAIRETLADETDGFFQNHHQFQINEQNYPKLIEYFALNQQNNSDYMTAFIAAFLAEAESEDSTELKQADLHKLDDVIIPRFVALYNHVDKSGMKNKQMKAAIAQMLPSCMHEHFGAKFQKKPKKKTLLKYLGNFITLLKRLSQTQLADLKPNSAFAVFIIHCEQSSGQAIQAAGSQVGNHAAFHYDEATDARLMQDFVYGDSEARNPNEAFDLLEAFIAECVHENLSKTIEKNCVATLAYLSSAQSAPTASMHATSNADGEMLAETVAFSQLEGVASPTLLDSPEAYANEQYPVFDEVFARNTTNVQPHRPAAAAVANSLGGVFAAGEREKEKEETLNRQLET